MGPSVLMILGFLLSQALSSDMQDVDRISIERNVTGVLGEDVYLRCLYTGNDTDTLLYTNWRRPGSMKKLAGFFGQKSLTSEGFSAPASPSNLTVKMRVLNLHAEGQYICEFATPEEQVMDQVFLTVLVRPDVTVQTKEETEKGTHYQSVSCSATSAKPAPQISWEINGSAPSDGIFSIQTEDAHHANGTISRASVLRFPTFRNDHSTVVCVLRHPALTEPRRMAAVVQTFVAPDVTMETGLVVEPGDGEGRMLRVVNCTALGGRPPPKIAWILAGGENTLSARESSDGGVFVSSVFLPAGAHEGENVTCVTSHPKLTSTAKRTLTLPTYNLSSLQLFHLSVNSSAALDSVFLEEREPGVALQLKVQGDVPSYQTKCTKDGSPLPPGVELVGDVISFRGPVALHYAGHYECQASFYKHKASVQLHVSVKPGIQPLIPVAPRISVRTWRELDSIIVECSAWDAIPAPNVSWSVPAGLTGALAVNMTSHNGSDSATAALTLPACLPDEQRLRCLVEHPLFEDPESREIVLPACARPNISVGVAWEQGSAYAKVECRVESVRPRAIISWLVEDSDGGADGGAELTGSVEEQAAGEEVVEMTGTLHLPLPEYLGRSAVCVVRHQSLPGPQRRAVKLQAQAAEPAVIRTFLLAERSGPLVQAVCVYSGKSGDANVTWLLPDNSTAAGVLSSSGREGSTLRANASFEFPLALYEGEALTCLVRQQHGSVKRRPVRVPQYYISSLIVVNKTIHTYKDGIAVHRVALEEHLVHQKIHLRVHGNVPNSKIICSRTDGSGAPTVRETSALTCALVFPMAASQRQAGQYICQASFYHHSATAYILVEVTSEEAQHMAFVSICFSSALAITLILVVTLCVFCKKHGDPAAKEHRKKHESVSTLTSLMHDPRSPEIKKAALPGVRGQQYAELVSIILVERTTV